MEDAEDYKIPKARSPGQLNFLDITSRHHSGTLNFEVTPVFLEICFNKTKIKCNQLQQTVIYICRSHNSLPALINFGD
jgi:hypothetical protein